MPFHAFDVDAPSVDGAQLAQSIEKQEKTISRCYSRSQAIATG